MGRTIEHKISKRGFTLAELLIVVVIVAILAGVSVPIFSKVFRDYKLKTVEDQKTAAKAAAVAAFYAGHDSKNNPVDIKETGVCTFVYDEYNNSVYVLNRKAQASDFSGYSIESYGLKIDKTTDYSTKVILVTFDGRYNTSNGNFNKSKGSFEEPILYIAWD